MLTLPSESIMAWIPAPVTASDLAKHQQTLSPFWSVVAMVGFLAVFGLLAWLSARHVNREVQRREAEDRAQRGDCQRWPQ